MQPIKIGFLTPYSSIYPSLTTSIVNGFYSAMPGVTQNMYRFQPEYIKQGGTKVVQEAVQKLIHFDNVDIVSGLVSYQSVPGIVPILESRKKVGFFFDLGEYIPFTQYISNHLFFNSFQLWQSEYALGYWAYKEFGDKGAVIMPLYDAGYHLQSSFRQGAIASGSLEIDYHVLAYVEGQSQVKGQLASLFEKMEKEPPSFIHALFCGSEAIDFFVEYSQWKLAGKIPLVVSAHMASEEVLSAVSNFGLTMYSASMWDYSSGDVLNTRFKQQYTAQTGTKADIFSLLGFEMGTVFSKLIPELTKRDWDAVINNLKKETIQSPRGERNFFLDSDYSTPIIDIEKVELGNNVVRKIAVSQGRSLKYSHSVFSEIHNECVTGWQNPYLCV